MNSNLQPAAKTLATTPGNARAILRPTYYLKAREAAKLLRLGMMLFDQADVVGGQLCRETISWRLERQHWMGVRWVTVTEYAPGFIRLRNDLMADIPKSVWPFTQPQIRSFELTFHGEEITPELGEMVFRFCNAVAEETFHFPWAPFEGVDTYPQYAWSQQAQAAYARRNQRQPEWRGGDC